MCWHSSQHKLPFWSSCVVKHILFVIFLSIIAYSLTCHQEDPDLLSLIFWLSVSIVNNKTITPITPPYELVTPLVTPLDVFKTRYANKYIFLKLLGFTIRKYKQSLVCNHNRVLCHILPDRQLQPIFGETTQRWLVRK